MRAWLSLTLAVLVVVSAVGAGVALDVVLPPPPAERPTAAAPTRAESGAWYCAVGDTAEGSGLTLLAAAPPREVPAAARIDAFGGGNAHRGGEFEVLAGTVVGFPVPEGRPEVGVVGRWWRSPAVVGRVWRRDVAGEPAGLVEGPCEAQPSDTWILPGVTTTGSNVARIVLANPFPSDAAVSIDLLTAEGRQTPERLKNVGVPQHTVRVVELNRHAPEREDLGAVVRVRAGRVVAEGWQSADPAVGGVAAVSLARLATGAAPTWTVPWFAAGGAESWLWVANHAERGASVSLTVHTDAGGAPPEGLEEISVPPGSVRRVDLRGVVGDDVASAAVTVSSVNGVPVVASAATRDPARDPARAAFAVLLGAPTPDPLWVIVSGTTKGRNERVHLVNPTGDPATVTVTPVVAGQELEPVSGIDVPPGARVTVDVAARLPAADHHALIVRAERGAVVAGFEAAFREGRRAHVATTGVPSAVWQPAAHVPPIEFDAGLPQRIGTVLGPAASASPTPLEPATVPPLPTAPAPSVPTAAATPARSG